MLQALTEYHLFAADDDLKEKELTPVLIRELLRRRFTLFWESGLLRIGETIYEGQAREEARGWKNYERIEQENATMFKGREETLLEEELDKNNKEIKKNCEEIKKKYELENTQKFWKTTQIYVAISK